MAIQENSLFKAASLLVLLFFSLVSAQSAREVDRIVVDGVEKPVFYEDKSGTPQKYFLGGNGNRVELAGHQRRKAQEKKEKFGVFGKKLYDTLSIMKAEEEVDVNITFALRPLPEPLKNKKLRKEEAVSQLQASFLDGVETLERRFGRLPSEVVDFKGKNGLRLRLRKSELLKLKTDPHIQSMDLPIIPRHEKVLRQAPLEESFMGSGWNSGGLHFSGDCGGGYGCGSGTYVGVLEKNPIWNSDSADHLNGPWFEKRPGTPIAPRHPHGLWTSSIIRNSGPGLGGSAFNGGGAYNANLSLSYPVAPESTMQDAYDWLLNRYNKIISHSWRFPRYLGGAHEAEANEFERQMDMATAGYPYVLNVLAAGNSGDTADGGENDACVDSSAVYNAPGWTAEQCQAVAWWNHNGLIVGAVDNDSTRSPFSAFRNGPEDNEAPHVMVRGSGIQLPWMTPFDSSTTCPTDTTVANTSGPLCGTSMAAPTVAALGAHISSIAALSLYPETVKGIIIASATSRPIRRNAWKKYAYDFYPFLDREIGAGIPHQPTVDSIAKNEEYVSNFSSGGYGFKKFFVPSNATSYEEMDTITITHPQGGRIHFYMTWVGNPSNVTPGTRYAPDDMDLQVETENSWNYYSNSYQNTTEEVIHPILPDSTTTFYVKKRLYYRALDENTPIWGSLVWTYAPPPVVEIHSPLDSSYTNQNEVPVEWSIDGRPDSSGSYSNPLSEGPNVIERCYDGYYFCDRVTVFLDQNAPVVAITVPSQDTAVGTEPILIQFTVDGVPRSRSVPLNPGLNLVVIDTLDAAGNRGADTLEVTYAIPEGVPIWPSWSHLSVGDVWPSSLKIAWTPAVDDSGVSRYRIYRDDILIDSVPSSVTQYSDAGLNMDQVYVYKVEAGDLRGNWTTDGPDSAFSTSDVLPPNPEEIATPIDQTVSTTIFASVSFLFNDTLPIQTGMAQDIIDTVRASVLRGVVRNREGDPLPGVSVSVLGAKAFGSTVTRDDGEYDLMVNGGGYVTLKMGKSGYLPVHRQMDIPWQRYVNYPEVVLSQLDSISQVISLDSGEPMQVFRASIVSDSDGSRQATLLIPTNTTGLKVYADGTIVPLESITLRATEYTVGENGPKAMPADLPPTSSYTYAVEYSADEALEEDVSVQFSQPIYSYLENFVGIPVGWQVPFAYYDRKKGQWIPQPDGRVLKIHSISSGKANLIVDSTGSPADSLDMAELGITNDEREKIAVLYSVGDSLWRVPVRHFSPCDFNLAALKVRRLFEMKHVLPKNKVSKNQTDQGNKECGSIIGCQSQTLGESFPLTGTPFRMHYSNDRMKGWKAENSHVIQLTEDIVSAGLIAVGINLEIAGRKWEDVYQPGPNMNFTFDWDGKDVYGRNVQGKQTLDYAIAYGFDVSYLKPPSVSPSFGIVMHNDWMVSYSRGTYSAMKRFSVALGSWKAPQLKLGGWSIDAHHAYDVTGKILRLGDGTFKNSADFMVRQNIQTVAGTGESDFTGDNGPALEATLSTPTGIGVGPDGSIYICDYANLRVRKVDPDGIITTVAGNGDWEYSGDGGLAIDAAIVPYRVDPASDGSLYITDIDHAVIRKVDPNGIITTIAGTGENGFTGDGGLAISAKISPNDIAVSPDGTIYIADNSNRVRRIGLDGTIHTIAGNGSPTFTVDSVPALEAAFRPYSLDLDREENVYIADAANGRLFKVSSDGFFTIEAGTGSQNVTGDGGIADTAGLQPWDVKIAEEADGMAIYFVNRKASNGTNNLIRKIGPDGVVTTIAGSLGGSTVIKDGVPPTKQAFTDVRHFALNKKGEILLSDNYEDLVRCIKPYLPGFENEAFVIPSAGGEEVYSFNSFGKHIKTLNGITGKAMLTFEYDESGDLSGILDAYGNETRIEMDGQGKLEKIVSPYGQETHFELNDSGYISTVINPAGEELNFEYTPLGLLTDYITPRGFAHEYSYDALGRLLRDDNPAGGYKELSRTETENGIFSTLTTAMGRVRTYLMEKLKTGEARKANTDPAGLVTETLFGTNGLVTTTRPDSTRTEVFQGPDPRFGMQAALPESTVVTLPSGLTFKKSRKSHGILSNQADPLTLQSLFDTIVVNGKVSTVMYENSTGRTVSTSPEGRTSSSATDSLGRIVGARIGGLDSVEYSYDQRGRLEAVSRGTGPSARLRSYEYDVQGHLSKMTDEMERIYEFEYDAAGRGTKVLLPDSQEVQFTYDSSGNIASITPPGKSAHAFAYTALDLDSLYAPPGLGSGIWSTLMERDLDQQPYRTTRPESTQIDYGYDSAGRLSEVQIPGGTYRYSYHSVTGNIDSLFSRDSVASAYEFDGSLLTRETWSGPVSGSLEFRYNADFRQDTLSVNDSLIAFHYDDDGLLIQADDLSLNYNTQNGLLRGTLVEGIEDTLSYNGFGEVIRLEAQSEDSLLYFSDFQRDKLGRITRKEERVGGTTTVYDYEYDLRGRLSEVQVDSLIYSSYEYDGNGNRMARILSSDTLSGTYDGQDRLIQYGGFGFSYNRNGDMSRLISNGDTTQYLYDVFGNLVSVQLPSGPLIEYVIDGRNRRVGKKVNGALVKGFLYRNQLNPVAELDGAGNVVARFVYGSKPNVPDLVIKQGVTYRIISDHLGSPRLVVNVENGAIVQRMNHDEFGNLLEDSNPGFQPFGFAGGVYDSHTSLIRFGARDYFPWVGRWTAKDPIRFRSESANLYGYVSNDPINFIDPTGLASVGCDNSKCWSDCLDEQMVDGALVGFGLSVPGMSIPKTGRAAAVSSAMGGSPNTTPLSMAQHYLPVLGPGARQLGRALNPVSKFTAPFFAGYLIGSYAICALQCGD